MLYVFYSSSNSDKFDCHAIIRAANMDDAKFVFKRDYSVIGRVYCAEINHFSSWKVD